MKITVNKSEQPVQDIFKPGTLVQSNMGIVLVTTKYNLNRDDLFSGVIIQHEDYIPGDWSDAWAKSCFTLFVGNVILEQENKSW